jgi:glycosyltransferase involved in cell wall biosynthesis
VRSTLARLIEKRTSTVQNRLRIAVVWPRPRATRVLAARKDRAQFPDFSDGLAYLDAEGIDIRIEESLGFPLNPFAQVHEFYSGLDPLRAIRLLSRARRYDAAICVGDATAFVPTWLRSLLRIRLPIVVIDPALSHDYPRRKRLQDYVLPRASCVVVFGEAQVEYLRKEYGTSLPTVLLHHRADVDFYAPAPAPSQDIEPYIFSVGNDVSRDFETLARAATLCADVPGFRHRFVVQTKHSVSNTNGRLDLRPNTVPYTELRTLYQQADIVVLPLHDSVHPGGINTLLEAMATARPIIVSNSRGVKDYVRDGETMVAVPPGDPQALASAIVRLSQSPAEARRLAENARRFVVEHCDNRVYARRLAAVVREAVGRS